MGNPRTTLWLTLFCVCFSLTALAQGPSYQPPAEKEKITSTGAWFGFYTKYHFNDKWAYYGEYHIRRRNGFDDMAQIYLRFGVTYSLAKYADLTVGVVNPYYWAPDQDDPNLDKVVPQFRTWEQLVFGTPFDHIKMYHQIRLEQRYKRDYEKGSDFKLTHRFRYKLTLYVPLNKPAFENHTLFLSLYNEIFIQAGKTVVYNHLEDNRAFAGLGYNLSEQVQVQAGYMYTFRHYKEPHTYEHRSIFRLSFYHHLDFHLDEHREKRDMPIH
ncbi:MAG: DUF2490 domain-containing protein [Reichenbachiella sp.]|uniref:DUF2490 domain-containing protein n=1 Tax=Reichenbachiella sp. TaxID=2184521 RepID=UPI003262F084